MDQRDVGCPGEQCLVSPPRQAVRAQIAGEMLCFHEAEPVGTDPELMLHRGTPERTHAVGTLRRQGRPSDMTPPLAPAHPRRGPAVTGHPDPAVTRQGRPTPIVIGRPSEGLIGNPAPSTIGPHPAPIAIGPPVVHLDDHRRPPNVSIVARFKPITVRRQVFVECPIVGHRRQIVRLPCRVGGPDEVMHRLGHQHGLRLLPESRRQRLLQLDLARRQPLLPFFQGLLLLRQFLLLFLKPTGALARVLLTGLQSPIELIQLILQRSPFAGQLPTFHGKLFHGCLLLRPILLRRSGAATG